jgi:hypothetical protein
MSAVGYPDLWLDADTPDKWRDKIHRLALFPTCYRIVETILVKTQLRVVVQPFYRILRTILCAFAWNVIMRVLLAVIWDFIRIVF